MSYDISFKVKVKGIDKYVEVGNCNINITWNLREMIKESTGLEWKNGANNGLCKNVIPNIVKGYMELVAYPNKYKQYESSNGWGTIEGCKMFFKNIINCWDDFCTDCETSDLVDVACFWIE